MKPPEPLLFLCLTILLAPLALGAAETVKLTRSDDRVRVEIEYAAGK